MQNYSIVFLVLCFLFLFAWYLSVLAARLDRLHHKIETTEAALNSAFVRRASVVKNFAVSEFVDPVFAIFLFSAASLSLEISDSTIDLKRQKIENDLNSSLQQFFADILEFEFSKSTVVHVKKFEIQAWKQHLDDIEYSCRKIHFAQHFYNDAITDAQRLRKTRIVKIFHLAGKAQISKKFVMTEDVLEILRFVKDIV